MKLILVILIAETSMAECRAIKAASTLSNVVSAAGNFLSSRRKTQPLALTAAAADAPAKASRLARVAEGATNGAMAVTSLATLFTSISGFVKPAEVVTPKVVSLNYSSFRSTASINLFLNLIFQVAPAENADGITHQDIFR